jgi:hypothetical protein
MKMVPNPSKSLAKCGAGYSHDFISKGGEFLDSMAWNLHMASIGFSVTPLCTL